MALDIGWALMAEGLEGYVDSIYFLFQCSMPDFSLVMLG